MATGTQSSQGDPRGAEADRREGTSGGEGREADEADPKRANRLRTPTQPNRLRTPSRTTGNPQTLERDPRGRAGEPTERTPEGRVGKVGRTERPKGEGRGRQRTEGEAETEAIDRRGKCPQPLKRDSLKLSPHKAPKTDVERKTGPKPATNETENVTKTETG